MTEAVAGQRPIPNGYMTCNAQDVMAGRRLIKIDLYFKLHYIGVNWTRTLYNLTTE